MPPLNDPDFDGELSTKSESKQADQIRKRKHFGKVHRDGGALSEGDKVVEEIDYLQRTPKRRLQGCDKKQFLTPEGFCVPKVSCDKDYETDEENNVCVLKCDKDYERDEQGNCQPKLKQEKLKC